MRASPTRPSSRPPVGFVVPILLPVPANLQTLLARLLLLLLQVGLCVGLLAINADHAGVDIAMFVLVLTNQELHPCLVHGRCLRPPALSWAASND